MERIERITRRVAAAEAVAASFLLAKDRPSDMFGAVFFDIREKARALKSQWEDQALETIQKDMADDLKDSGIEVVELKISLGRYKGSRFVTSAKIKVKAKTKEKTDELLTHLQTKYSPKYQLKTFDVDVGEAEYNVR